MLTRPLPCKVGVASADNYDDAMYRANRGERFFGATAVYDHQATSNRALASRLRHQGPVPARGQAHEYPQHNTRSSYMVVLWEW